MSVEKTINAMPFKESANKKWYLSMKPASPKETLTVKFDDGKSYKYLGTGVVNVGDPVIIDYGGASSYKMGNVVEIESGITIKRTHALKPLFTFTTDPGKGEIKKNIAGVIEMKEYNDVSSFFDNMMLYNNNNRFHIVDQLVAGVLNAISVIAFSNLAGDKAVAQAKTFLAGEKSVPGFVFGRDFTDSYFAASSDIPYAAESAETSLTGFYPGWKEDVLNCDVWKSEELNKIDMDWDEREQAYYLYYINGSKKLENFFKKSDSFKKMTNELVFRSALSILIRGGFRNLLEAALSVKMPIIDFYDKMKEFAKEIGSVECYEMLNNTDYKNKTFDQVPVTTQKAKVSTKGFTIKDGVLTKYTGNSEEVIIPDSVKIIDEYVFSEKKQIKKIIIPDSVKQVKKGAFSYCYDLEEIIFGNGVTTLAPAAIAVNKKLKSVDLSNTKIKTIRKQCFQSCENLETVKLPNCLKSIEDDAFKRTAIKELHFPATIEKINVYGFGSEINEVYFAGTNQVEFNSLVLTDGGKNGKIHCIKGSDLWKMFESQIEKAEAWNRDIENFPGLPKRVIPELVEL